MPNARSQDFKLENMRGSFLNILKPQKMEENGVVKFRYNGTFLWPKSTAVLMGKTNDGKELNVYEEAARVATEQWGDKAAEWIKNGVIKSPFLDGDGPQGISKKTGERHKGYEGHRFLRASANEDRQPQAFDDKRGADGKLVKVTDGSRLYSGAYYHIVVNLFAWEHAKNGKGLSVGLNMVQFARDGERLGGSGQANPDDFFEGVVDKGAAPAATQNGQGAAGLFA